MCYHTSQPKKDALESFSDRKGYLIRGLLPEYYHVSGFDRPFLPVTLNAEPKVIQTARWKLLPYWVKTEEEAKKYANTLNADSSEIFEKKSYSPFILKNRGLLWVDGFYEPHRVEGQKQTENFYIHKPAKEIFSIGIVWAPWADKESGEHYNTFAVITVNANPMMAEIHNEKKRMPLIVDDEEREAWLTGMNTKQSLQQFFNHEYSGDLIAYRTKYRVTAARGVDTNVPEIQDPADDTMNAQPGELF